MTSQSYARRHPQILPARSTANPVRPTPICPTDPTTRDLVRLSRLAQGRDAQAAHSSSPTVWLEECPVLYSHLRKRGYPSKPIDSTFRTVNWNQPSKMLEPKRRAADDKRFARYRGCVFSNRNAPGSAELRMEMDLSLEELRGQGQGRDIFPPSALFATWRALPIGYLLPQRLSCDPSMAASVTQKS